MYIPNEAFVYINLPIKLQQRICPTRGIGSYGLIFVFDRNNKLVIADFGFDGWGEKTSYKNDEVALNIIAELYPDHGIIPIVVIDLFQYGGILHYMTQQQPQLVCFLIDNRGYVVF